MVNHFNLQKKFSKNILQYLQRPKILPFHDCHDFLRLVSEDVFSLLKAKPYQYGKCYHPGSQSFVVDKAGAALHSQFYLDQGLFLGKMGDRGPVVISHYQEQERLRGGYATLIVSL